MEMTTENMEDKIVIKCKGEIEIHAAPDLKDEIKIQVNSGANMIIIDMNDVTYIDSSGLGAVVAGRISAIRKNVRLILVHIPAEIIKLMKKMKLYNLFEVYENIGDIPKNKLA